VCDGCERRPRSEQIISLSLKIYYSPEKEGDIFLRKSTTTRAHVLQKFFDLLKERFMGKYLNEKACFYRVLKRFNYCSSPSKRAAFYLDFHFTAGLMLPGKGGTVL
jgi:hypothetical protein